MGNFSLNRLSYFGIQNSFIYTVPSRFSYYYNSHVFKKVGVYRLDLFYNVLRSSLAVVGNVVAFYGKLFCASSSQEFQHFISEFSSTLGQFYTTAWSPGMLSNWATYYKFIRTRYSFRISTIGTFKAYTKIDKKYRGLLNMVYVPDFVFALTAGLDASVCKEASKLLVPSIGIVEQSSYSSLSGITYPFFSGNQLRAFVQTLSLLLFRSFVYYLSKRVSYRHFNKSKEILKRKN